MTEYRGGCHCGVLKVIYRTEIDPARWPLRHDGCSFCRRHGVVGTSDPAGEIALEIGDDSKVRRYRFAQKSADFLLCGVCGVFVAALTNTAGGARAVINARVLEGVALNFDAVTSVRFDDETPIQRAERRSRNWTPVRASR
ncbi:MAG: GFA family protein [Steroidobacteraceae bacterium]